MKNRRGFNKNSCERMAQKVFDNGITHSQTKGRLNNWDTGLYFRNKNANNIRLYGDKAYIFAGKTLVTVIQIPTDLTKNMKSMVKVS